MEFELWWLLPIPVVFFALGWIAARIDIRHLLRESSALPLSYFRGLNFLLNEQPDKAIESFIEVVKVDPQTVDLHFALGSLFRRQGEIDRAIRMHQNLLDRPGPARGQATRRRIRARAGLSSRGPPRSRRGALHEARRVAVRASVARLPAVDLRAGKGLAQGDRRHAPDGGAREAAVLQGDRALLLRARAGGAPDVGFRGGARGTSTRRSPSTGRARGRRCCWATSTRSRASCAEAIAAWQRIESQNPAFLSLVAERLADAYRKTRQREPGTAGAARVPAAISVARPPQHRVRADARRRRAGGGRRAHQGGARAQPDAARPRPPARSAAPRRRPPIAATTSSS